MPTVKIPPVLRPRTGGESEIAVAGEHRRRGARGARRRAPRHPRASSSPTTAQLNRYVNVYLNDEDVRVLDGLETAVADSDTVVILPAMAGGCARYSAAAGKGGERVPGGLRLSSESAANRPEPPHQSQSRLAAVSRHENQVTASTFHSSALVEEVARRPR